MGFNSDGVLSGKATAEKDTVMSNISFSIIPVENGITALARLRLD